MIEKITERRLINAILREEKMRDKRNETNAQCDFKQVPGKLRLAIESHRDYLSKNDNLNVVLRGNAIGTHWMMLDANFTISDDGWMEAFKAAFQIAKKVINAPGDFEVDVGIPTIEDYRRTITPAVRAQIKTKLGNQNDHSQKP